MTSPDEPDPAHHVVVRVADRLDRTIVERLLQQGGHTVETHAGTQPALPADCAAVIVDLDEAAGEPSTGGASGPDGPAVIALCDEGDASAVQRLVDNEVDELLVKPLRVAESLARIRAAIARRERHRALRADNARLVESLRRAQDSLAVARQEALTHLTLVSACRDDDTLEHQLEVARIACAIATALELPEQFVRLLELAAPLHDLGKIAIPDAVLFKPTRLTEEEMRQVHRHCTIGAQLLSGSQAPHMRLAQEIAASHHERWDGSGYPAGLAGDDIPLAARIVGLADAYDTMLRDRPYRAALTEAEARRAVLAAAGSHFDPRTTSAFDTAWPPGARMAADRQRTT